MLGEGHKNSGVRGPASGSVHSVGGSNRFFVRRRGRGAGVLQSWIRGYRGGGGGGGASEFWGGGGKDGGTETIKGIKNGGGGGGVEQGVLRAGMQICTGGSGGQNLFNPNRRGGTHSHLCAVGQEHQTIIKNLTVLMKKGGGGGGG
ncbi:unnamed protein product [Dicrocoelium dendriticum]|nr:unnamed protein product [Dicrocoelium dendriticum]